MKKIKILAVCNMAGKPVQPGEVVEAEDFAAGYLIGIGKAEEMPEFTALTALAATPEIHEVEPEPALERKANEVESRRRRSRFERKPPVVEVEENT